MEYSRETIQDLYVRIAYDSNFSLPFDKIAHMVADMTNTCAIDVWTKFGDLSRMQAIAKGNDPYIEIWKKKYKRIN